MANKKFSTMESVKFGWNTVLENLKFFFIVLLASSAILIASGMMSGNNKEQIDMLQQSGSAYNMMQQQGSDPFAAVYAKEKDEGVLIILARIALSCLRIVLAMGFINIAIRFCNDESSNLTDLIEPYPLFFKYIGGTLLYGLITFVTLGLPFAFICIMTVFVLLFSSATGDAAAIAGAGGQALGSAYNTVLSSTGLTPGDLSLYGTIASVIMLGLMIFGINLTIRCSYFPYYIIEYSASPLDAIKNSYAATKDIKKDLMLFKSVLFLINLAGVLALGLGLFITIPVTMVANAHVFKKINEYDNYDPETGQAADQALDENSDLMTNDISDDLDEFDSIYDEGFDDEQTTENPADYPIENSANSENNDLKPDFKADFKAIDIDDDNDEFGLADLDDEFDLDEFNDFEDEASNQKS